MTYDDPTGPGGGPDPTAPLDAIDSGDERTRPAALARRGVTALLAALALLVAGAVGAGLAGGNGPDELAVSAGSTASSTADEEAGEDGNERQGRIERFKDWAEKHRGGALRGGHGFGHGFGIGPMGGALHGTFVVPDPDGGYQTLVAQRGEVTAVSATSLTVKSDDGFTASYRLTDDTTLLGAPDGVDAIEEGDEVSVGGVRSDGTTRALHVADLSRLGELRDDLRGPVPSPGATTQGTSAAV